LEAIKKVNPGPIRFLVDTHYHPNHTGGNPNFARIGAIIFAREETRKRLIQPLPQHLQPSLEKRPHGLTQTVYQP
jgi:glyoxylase-like metal-dependent hydrolase (beta-lactamase superfamily II)